MKILQPIRQVIERVRPSPEIKKFIKKRRWSIVLFVISIAAIVALTLSIRQFFRIESRTVDVGIYSDKNGPHPIDGHISIRKENKLDVLRMYLLFASGPQNVGKHFTIRVPANLKISRETSMQGTSRGTPWTTNYVDGEIVTWYPFTITSANVGGAVVFEGAILSSSARELDFSLSLDVFDQPEFPLRLTIVGLDRSRLEYVNPEPGFRTTYALDYKQLTWKTLRDGPVSFQIQDKQRSGQTDYRIFVTGVLLGVFVSFSTAIIWDLVKEKET